MVAVAAAHHLSSGMSGRDYHTVQNVYDYWSVTPSASLQIDVRLTFSAIVLGLHAA